MKLLLASLACLGLAAVITGQPTKSPDAQQTLEKIKQLGGSVEVKRDSAGRTYLQIGLTGAKFKDADLTCLKDVPKLCSLDL